MKADLSSTSTEKEMRMINMRKINLNWKDSQQTFPEPIRVASSDNQGRKLVVQVEAEEGAELELHWKLDGASDKETFNYIGDGKYEVYYPTRMLAHKGILQGHLHLIDSEGELTSEPLGIHVFSGIPSDNLIVDSDEELQARIVELEDKLSESDRDNDNLRAHIESIENEKRELREDVERGQVALEEATGRVTDLEEQIANSLTIDDIARVEDGVYLGPRVIIPDGVVEIGLDAANGAVFDQPLNLPESLTSIGNYAFDSAQFSQDLVLPENLTSIGGYAFEGAQFSKDLVIPESVEDLNGSPFYRSTIRGTLYIPEKFKGIDLELNWLRRPTTVYYPQGTKPWLEEEN